MMFLTITTVNNKTYYAFYSTPSKHLVLNDFHNNKFVRVVDINGYKNFLQTSVIESIKVDDSKEALDNFKKLTGGIN